MASAGQGVGTAEPGTGTAGRTRGAARASVMLLLAVLCVPQVVPTAVNLVDGSWVLGNSLAHEVGLSWGTELAYTYGPLGFLKSPVPFSGSLVLLGLAFWLASAVAFLWASLRLQGPGPVSWLVSFLAASSTSAIVDVAIPVAALALVGLALRLRQVRWPVELGFLGVGAVGALLLLTKFNAGVTALAIGGVLAVLGPRPLRCGVGFGLGAVGGLLLLWWGAGGPLTGLWVFLLDSIEMASGYRHALGNGSRTTGAVLVHAAAAALLAVLLLSAWLVSRGADRLVRAGAVCAAMILGASSWLQGFTRFDPGHLAIFFATVGPVALVLLATAVADRPALTRYGTIAACYALSAGPLLVVLGSPGGGLPVGVASPSMVIHPRSSVASVRDAVAQIRHDPARAERLASLRSQFAAEAGLAPGIAQALEGRSAHAEPQAVGAVWAAGGRWRPVPVYQTHMAYTAALDERNATAAAGADAPDLILREDVGLDGTNPLWQSPRLQLEYLCRYRQTAADGRWRILTRAPTRCAPILPVGTVRAEPGEAVAVPEGTGIVVATIAPVGASTGRSEVRCDDRTYPLMQRLPTGPLIVRIPVSLGWTAQVNPTSCDVVTFSTAVDVEWAEIPLTS